MQRLLARHACLATGSHLYKRVGTSFGLCTPLAISQQCRFGSARLSSTQAPAGVVYSAARDDQWYEPDTAADSERYSRPRGPRGDRGRGRGGGRGRGRGGRGNSSGGFTARGNDWTCSECGEMNFGWRTSCRQCDSPAPEGHQASSSFENRREERPDRPGDWTCSSCGQHNFAWRTECFKCGEAAPEGAGGEDREAGRGAPQSRREYNDWTCPECGEVNYEKRWSCRECNALRPPQAGRRGGADRGYERQDRGRERQERAMREGDWTCPDCGDVNFAFRTECRKCSAPKP